MSLYSVHVRRTDKINTEAAFHSIDEYMVHVEEWYEQLSVTQSVEQKRVFIATDEPSVITEAKNKWDFLISLSGYFSACNVWCWCVCILCMSLFLIAMI